MSKYSLTVRAFSTCNSPWEKCREETRHSDYSADLVDLYASIVRSAIQNYARIDDGRYDFRVCIAYKANGEPERLDCSRNGRGANTVVYFANLDEFERFLSNLEEDLEYFDLYRN